MDWGLSNRKGKSNNNPFDQDSDGGTYPPVTESPSYRGRSSEEQQLRRDDANRWRSPVVEQDNQLSNEDFQHSHRRHYYQSATAPVDAYSQSKLADDDGERQINGLKSQIHNVKQDTLQSTRNALQNIQASHDTARNTLSQLGEQASQIANVDRQLGLAKTNAAQAAQKTTHLKRLNRSIFVPVLKNPFQRKARAKHELEEAERQHAEACSERDAIAQFEHKSKTRTEDYALRARHHQQDDEKGGGRTPSDRKRYQFEPDEEDDAIEDEIEQNLDLVSSNVGNLKQMALAMRDEVNSQNDQLERITDKVDPINQSIFATTHKLNRIK